jgi:hypothetical protein
LQIFGGTVYLKIVWILVENFFLPSPGFQERGISLYPKRSQKSLLSVLPRNPGSSEDQFHRKSDR